jgi:putative membrane protein insertion efficiency factor
VSIGSVLDASPAGCGVVARVLLWMIRIYRIALSPLLGGYCRYLPSCSLYAQEAIERYGARRGLALGVRRVLRCHPFRPGGFDPVP